LAVGVVLVVLVAMSAMAGTWTGYISEAGCGAKHMSGSEKDVKCVTGCVKKGAAPVFVTEDKKVLKINDASKVMDHLGHKVEVTGDIEGDTLKIQSVKMAH
jgi:hypothetical protein